MCNIKNNRMFDESIKLKDNAMLKHRPDLFNEWDFDKNDELGLDIYNVTYGTAKKVWWICPDCGSSYDMKINERAGSKKFNCPYCIGKRTNYTNSLATLQPNIAKEWHSTKNDELTPNDVPCHTSKKVWWECVKGHEWETRVGHRVNMKSNCPYCSNKKLLIGFNDMWTTNPELASLLLNPDDGYKYMQSSNVKVDWKCQGCETIIKNKDIYSIKDKGLSCLNCSDGSSFGERLMYSLLSYLEIDFKYDTSFDWSNRKRYDFYLYDYNSIIEVHGEQHYTHGFDSLGGDSVERTIDNDSLKKKLALSNHIENYIEIDARKSSYKWIMNSIMNSDLKWLLDISEEEIKDFKFNINSSKVNDVWKLWNTGMVNIEEIELAVKIHKRTVYKYLTLGRELNICSY